MSATIATRAVFQAFLGIEAFESSHLGAPSRQLHVGAVGSRILRGLAHVCAGHHVIMPRRHKAFAVVMQGAEPGRIAGN